MKLSCSKPQIFDYFRIHKIYPMAKDLKPSPAAKKALSQMKRSPKKDPLLRPKKTREFRKVITLSEDELALVERFCGQHRIQNQAKFFREAILEHILHRMDENYPKLF